MEKGFLKYLDEFEVGLALNHLEKFFWNFCDDYIEIVKHRLYRPEEFGSEARYSGQKTVYIILYKLLQDFSIFFPYITEEIYQEIYHDKKSIHLTEIKELNFNFQQEKEFGNIIVDIISIVRGEKSSNNLSLKTEVTNLEISSSKEIKEAIEKTKKDFQATLFVKNLKFKEIKSGFKVTKIELAEAENKE